MTAPDRNLLSAFRVMLLERGSEDLLRFDCQAAEISHAIEQAQDAYPDSIIASATWVGEGSPVAIVPDVEGHFSLPPQHQGAWITVDNASVRLYRTDEGIIADIRPLGCEMGESDSSAFSLRTDLAATALGDFEDGVSVQDAVDGLLPHQVRAHAAVISAESAAPFLAALEEGEAA